MPGPDGLRYLHHFQEPSTDDNKFSGEDLLHAAVDFDLDALPSLPSLFKFPEPHPPVDMPASAPRKQDFGAPSNFYYDRRAFGDVRNFKQFEEAKGIRFNTEVKALKPKSAARGRRKATRLAPVTIRPLVEDSSTAAPPVVKFSVSAQPAFVEVKLVVSDESAIVSPPSTVTQPTLTSPAARAIPIVKLTPTPHPAIVSRPPSPVTIPAPGSEKWNTAQTAVLTQRRKWNDQVRRHCLLVPAPLPIPVPAPVDEPWRRYLAPPVLIPLKPRLNLSDRLSALFKEAKDTIDALNEKSAEDTVSRKQDVSMSSAVALEEGRGQEVFVIRDDDEEIIVTSRQEQESESESATVIPGSSSLVSSISASRSMAALASVSTRSVTGRTFWSPTTLL